MQLTFKTIDGSANAEFKDRGSKFLGYCFPVKNTNDVKAALAELKKEHPKAGHHCYAYRLGIDGNQYRANDDGEPAGSAGRPILGQIDSAGITDTLVVVLRYFGGTLLGVPGLINAYKTAAADCLALVNTIEKNVEQMIQLEFDYSIMNDVMTILKQCEANIYKQEMQLFCVFEAGIPLIRKDAALKRLSDIHSLEMKLM